jgi:hypothetical protein
MDDLLTNEITRNIGKNIIFWINNLRFEGKILNCDKTFLKYYDKHKGKERYVKIADLSVWEVTE